MHFAFVPTIVAASSALVLLVHGSIRLIRTRDEDKAENSAEQEPLHVQSDSRGFWRRRVAASGGLSIFLFKISRLAGVAALFGLYVDAAPFWRGPMSDIRAAFVITAVRRGSLVLTIAVVDTLTGLRHHFGRDERLHRSKNGAHNLRSFECGYVDRFCILCIPRHFPFDDVHPSAVGWLRKTYAGYHRLGHIREHCRATLGAIPVRARRSKSTYFLALVNALFL